MQRDRVGIRTTAAALAAAALAGCGADRPALRDPHAPRAVTRVEERARPAPLDFEAAPGWHVRTNAGTIEDERAAQAWAATVPFAEDEEPIGEANYYPGGWPDKTEATLPADGIMLLASFPLHTRNPLPPIPDVPERSLPLSVEGEPHTTAIEGQDPEHAQTSVRAIVNGRYVSVRVVFGTPDPPEELLLEAERQLRRLIVAGPPQTSDEIDDFGIRMEVPDAWQRRLFRWGGAEPILHVATVPVTDLYDGGSARRDLGRDDFFLVLSENYALASRYEEVSLPVSVRPIDECRTCEILDNGTSPPPGHSLFYRTFSVDGRRFDLYVEFGKDDPSEDDLARVNDALSTLTIGPPESPPWTESPAVVEDRPVEADVPPGWIAEDDPGPASTGPRVVAAFGTWDFPFGGICGPEPALETLPPDGGLVWVTEHADPGNSGDYIELTPIFDIDLQTPPARWECAAAAPSRMYLFRVDGRYLEVHLALGPDADEATVREAGDLIRSLRA